MTSWEVVAPVTSSIWRQRQKDLCEFKVSLVYGASSRTARAIQRDPVSKKLKNEKGRKKKKLCKYKNKTESQRVR